MRPTPSPPSTSGQFPPLMPSYRSTLDDLFGVRFIALGVPIEQIDKALKPGDLDLIARTKDAYVYENPRALPRVMLATRLAQGRLRRDDPRRRWPDVDLRHTVLLENAPAGAPTAGRRHGAHSSAISNTEIEIEAEAPGGGFLVLNDVWHPWWRATVDGKPAEILKANVMFRAVARAARQAHGAVHDSIRSRARSPS